MQSNLDYRSRARAANPYAQQDDNPSFESAAKEATSTTNLTATAGADGMAAFYNEIASIQDDIRTFNDNVARISDMHSRSLNATDDAATQRVNQQLEELVADTSALSNVLRRRIKALQKQGGSGRDGEIRKQQVRLGLLVCLVMSDGGPWECRLASLSRSSWMPSKTTRLSSSSTGRSTSSGWSVSTRLVRSAVLDIAEAAVLTP